METLQKYKLPPLPEAAHTFDCITFGKYTPRGYNPSLISSESRGLALSYLDSGEWFRMDPQEEGSGCTFVIRDKEGKELGRIYKPSAGVMLNLGKKADSLVFRAT